MAKGFGYEYYKVLKKTVVGNEAKGIYVKDLRILAEYHFTKQAMDIRFAPSMFGPLTEMFLVANNINHSLNRNREGAYVSGIGFVKPETRELIETLELGIGKSNQTADEMDRLYKIIFED